MDVTENLLFITGTQVLCWNIYYATVSWLNGWELNFHDIINKNKLCLYTDQILPSDVCMCSLWNAMAPFSNRFSHTECMTNTLSSRSLQSEARVILISVPCTCKSRVNLELKGHIYILILFEVLDCLYNKTGFQSEKELLLHPCILGTLERVCSKMKEMKTKRWSQLNVAPGCWNAPPSLLWFSVLLDKSLPVYWTDSQGMSTSGTSLDPTTTWKLFFRQLLSTTHWENSSFDPQTGHPKLWKHLMFILQCLIYLTNRNNNWPVV